MSSFPLIAEIRQKQPDWRAVKFKTTAEVQLGKMLQPKQERPEDTKEPYLRAANLSWSGVNLSDVQEMWVSPFEKSKYDLRAGDVLVSEGGDVGRSSYLAEDLPGIYFQNAINRVRAGKESDGRFLYYWLNVVKNSGWLEILCNRATIAHFTADKLRETEIILPPLPTQRRIAAYLDRETARIDALVAEKEALLRLLEEKRASLISHAVTRGLNPKAKLKPSGIPWLGVVPEHWSLKPFRHLVSIASGQVDPRSEEFRDWLLIAPNHIESGTGRITGRETAAEQGAISGKYLVRKGEVIYSKIRPELRKACIAPKDCLCSADMYPMRTKPELDPGFLFYFLLGEAFSRLVILESMRVAMPKVNREMLAPCPLPLPPISEQSAIAAECLRISKATDLALAEIQTSVHLLREKRTSLISAAVTGEMAAP